ncbi:hypothetical protein BDZ45DRAFT_745083 [Acephala macrosclerotiorum]|nr:hypothetical protein BDZ45DRAFT_745083 [Acephala macrosclerotiorum]
MSRDGMYKLLPRSLVQLRLKFRFSIRVFYHVNPHTQRLEEVRRKYIDEDLPKESYQWIFELAEYKSHLPLLKDVALWETAFERYLDCAQKTYRE